MSCHRNTTTATRIPRIRTIIASRLVWSESHDTFCEFARKAGTNSSGAGNGGDNDDDSDEDEADPGNNSGDNSGNDDPASVAADCSGVPASFDLFPASFFSQSRQRLLPSETGNPQASHFSTRS
jgi:hypothetical protein